MPQFLSSMSLDGADKIIFPSGDASGATDVAAINAVISNGGVVQLVQATLADTPYYINSPLLPASGSGIRGAQPWSSSGNDDYGSGSGASAGTTIYAVGGFTGAAAINLTNTTSTQYSGVSLENFCLEGYSMTQGHGILVDGAWGACFINGVTIHRPYADCLHFQADSTSGKEPDEWVVTRTKLSAARTGYGVWADNLPDSVFTDVNSSENDLDGWLLNWSTNTRLVDCKSENNGQYGFHFTGQGYPNAAMHLTGCTTHLNNYDGFYWDNPNSNTYGQYLLSNCFAIDDGQAGGTTYAAYRSNGASCIIMASNCFGYGAAYGAYQGGTAVSMTFTGSYLKGTTASTHDDGTNTYALVNQLPVTPAGSTPTPVPLTQGGTGQSTAQSAMNSLAGGVTSGSYLRGNGTNVVLSTIQSADLPSASTSAKGAIQLGGGTTNFLRADGTWAVPSGGGSSVLDWINVANLGADMTGATFSDTAMAAAFTALGTSPGIIYVPSGTIKLANSYTFIEGQGLIGDGHGSTRITYTGSGTLFTATQSYPGGTFNDGLESGHFYGFTLDGSGAGSSAVGFLMQDVQGGHGQDVEIYGFGGAGLKGAALHSGWCEEWHWDKLLLLQNGVGALFTQTSFDYGSYDITVVSNPGADVIRLSSNVVMNGCTLNIRGNVYASSGNTAAVINIEPGNTSGTSYLTNCLMNVSVETAGTGTGHYLVNMGSTNAASQFNGTGVLSIFPATVASQGINNPNNLPLGFSGIVLDGTTTTTMSAGDGFALHGGSSTNIIGSPTTTLASFGNVIYNEFSNVWVVKLASGANSISFDALGGGARDIDLIFVQPSSGAAGTITWPSTIKTPTGFSLSATNNATDWVRVKWLGSTINLGYAAILSRSDGSGGSSFTGGTLTSYLAPAVTALTDGTTVSINAANGNVFTWSLGGSSHTLGAPSNPVNGQVITIDIAYSGTFTPLFNAAFLFGTDGQPTWTATSGKTDAVSFRYSSAKSGWLCQGWKLGF